MNSADLQELTPKVDSGNLRAASAPQMDSSPIVQESKPVRSATVAIVENGNKEQIEDVLRKLARDGEERVQPLPRTVSRASLDQS